MGRDRRLSGHPLPHRRRREDRLHAARRRGRFRGHHPRPARRRPRPRAASAPDRPDGRRPRDDPQHARGTFRIRIGPRTGRLRLQRRRPAQPDGTPLPAQAQPHQPLHVRIPRLPVRESDARPFRGVHAARTRMAPGARGTHLGTLRRAAGHAAGLRPLRGAGNAGRLHLRRRQAGRLYVRQSTSTRSTPTSKRPIPITTEPLRSSTNSSPSICPNASR